MVQLPAMNTTQFKFVKTRLPRVATAAELAEDTALPLLAVEPTITRLVNQRVVLPLPNGIIGEFSSLARPR